MARLLIVGAGLADWPALQPLAHDPLVVPADTQALTQASDADLVILDGRDGPTSARSLARLFESSGGGVPLLLVLTEAGLPKVTTDWKVSDLVLDTASPAELDTRIRLLIATTSANTVIRVGAVAIDEVAYSATVNGEPLSLTFTEFELLKYLAAHPDRVFSRDRLLTDVWGYDYYGGTRTIDVHIRRLRAKLGPEHESLISTVRNVGYRFSGGHS